MEGLGEDTADMVVPLGAAMAAEGMGVVMEEATEGVMRKRLLRRVEVWAPVEWLPLVLPVSLEAH